jgi:hypothetical protein
MGMNFKPQGHSPLEGMGLLPPQIAALGTLRPEQHLLFTLLAASWDSLSKHVSLNTTRAKRRVEEELAWVNSEERGPFSFRFCCEHLDLDPGAVREGIHRSLTQRQRGEKGEGLKYRARSHQRRTPKRIAA